MHACSSSVLSIAICIMATSLAWLSILVKCGQDIVKPRTVVKCSWEETFLVLYLINLTCQRQPLKRYKFPPTKSLLI